MRLRCSGSMLFHCGLSGFVDLAYNPGNLRRRLALPESLKHWSLTILIETGERLVRHARRLVFQLAEVLVTREMLTGILERVSRIRVASCQTSHFNLYVSAHSRPELRLLALTRLKSPEDRDTNAYVSEAMDLTRYGTKMDQLADHRKALAPMRV